ncbi:MAG: MFS transporter [Thermodesulfobacteriota bacterium]
MKQNNPIHWAWIILATCFVNLFINYSVRLGYGVVLPEMIRHLEFGRAAGGSIYNAYLLAYIILTPVSGYLTDTLGARRVITVCSLILGLGVVFMGTIGSLWEACLFYAIVGVGATGMWAPVLSVVQRWFAPHRRGLALGILSTGYGLGFASMGAAFPWIVAHYTWRYAWYLLGAGALIMSGVNALLLRSNPESSGYAPWGERNPLLQSREKLGGPLPHGRSLCLVLKHPTFWLIGLSYFSIAYSLYGITTFMVDYAAYQIGLPLIKASLLATVHGIGQIIGVLTILPASDFLGRKRALIISNSFVTGCLIGILFTGSSWQVLFILVGIMALFYGATFPLYGACAGDYFPRELIGTVIGAWTPLYGGGAILAHWVTGILRDTTGIYDHAFLINSGMAAAALFLISFVAKKSG